MTTCVDCIGQNRQWRAHHRSICKSYNRFASSEEYQALPLHEQMDALLLSQFIAQLQSYDSSSTGESSPISIFMSLLPGPTPAPAPPLCVTGSQHTIQDRNQPFTSDELYARFGNNNFAIHSHLRSFAHGVFPLASRLFNHSCLPNAAARFVLLKDKPVVMEVVALRNIGIDEEVQ
jgi:hypothetical protein